MTKDVKNKLLEIYNINESLLEKYRLLPNDKIKQEIKKKEEYINRLLDSIDINKEMYNDIFNYINNIFPYLTPDLVDDLVYEEGKSLVTKKTINMIRDYIINNLSVNFIVLDNISCFNETFDESFDSMNKGYHIKKVIIDDFYKILIDNIKESNLLNDVKYKLSFIESNPNLLEKDEYLSSNFLSNFNGITTKTYTKIKEELISNIALKAIDCLSTFLEEDLENDLYLSEIKLYLNVLSSSLTLLEEDTIPFLLEYYESNDEEYYIEDINDKIYDIFNEEDVIKSKYKILSLK